MQKIYSKIESIVGNVITVKAAGVANGELAVVTSNHGESWANVIKLDEDMVSLQVFSGAQGVSTGDQVRFLNVPMRVSYSDDLLGRVFDGTGRPRDNGPQMDENLIEIGGPSVNPARRIIPRNMIRTGLPMIDLFNTLVESQKLPIFSSSGEPYNELLARIAMQAEVDLIILGGMGLKFDDYLYFRDTLEEGGAMSRTIMFIHTASDPTVECMLVPDMALAVAERFALDGKKVLVLLTDMTNFADALKEMAITMDQVPSNRGYPGDLYSSLASRYEKAVDFEGAGSVTILGVTTMPGDDVTHPVPDNTGYITEGQYYLKGGRIEPFGSLSRLKQQVNSHTRSDHRALMDGMIKLYASYLESVEKRSMGFMMTEWDEKLLKYGALFEEKMMDLSVNIPLETALDLGWEILAECFAPNETGLRTDLITERWPKPLAKE
ncbi:MAG TPA: V-type ATP synthase subunit B [Sphaerochaeta sp.]|nr:V-type ATP synthase subunit B [Sphaerochaeta sp.]